MRSTTLHIAMLVLSATLLSACPRSTGGEGGGGGAGGGGGGGGGGGASARFFLPTGEPENTSAPVIEVDADGGIHAVYPAYAGGNAFYAYCPAGCSGTADVSVVVLHTESSVASTMIALDATGRPHILLGDYEHVIYASCDGDCRTQEAWTTTVVLDHGGDYQLTGEAFALDPQGRPRFVMHTEVAFLGVGQGAPETYYVTCDEGCTDPAQWSQHLIAQQIWQSSHLRFDATGRAHLAMVATVEGDGETLDQDVGAYAVCAGDCTRSDGWLSTGLEAAYATEYSAVAIKPTIALALTAAGNPRVMLMMKTPEGARALAYLACDSDCIGGGWGGTILEQGDALGPGLDLALDGHDHPRFVYTRDYNIGIGRCDEARCDTAESRWVLDGVELGSDMPTDDIILWPGCTVAAWLLHSPSIALDANGAPRVGYQARDISGGLEDNPDPTEPDCVAGTDMTLSRVALLGS